jgi:murein DD-endopeptidase MepM/ murein hydrolase activator NlpD
LASTAFSRARAEQSLVIHSDVPEHDLARTTGAEQPFGEQDAIADAVTKEGDTRAAGPKTRVRSTVEWRRIAKGVRIHGSLGQSLAAVGLAGLTQTIQQTLAPRIALATAARAGDTLRVIVEAEYSGGKFVRFGTLHALEYTSLRAGKLEAFWFEPTPGSGAPFDDKGRSLRGTWLRTPVRYDRISSGYNLKRRHPLLKRVVPHLGVDYSACRGTPVWAAADGLVTFAGRLGANGNLVSIRHGSGYETHYAHLARISPGIRAGRHLKQRQLVGFVGSTGRSTGPHLHFALKRDGRFVDPAKQLDKVGAPLPRAAEPRFRETLKRMRASLAAIPITGQAQRSARVAAR